MIDVRTEEVIPVREVPEHVPKKRGNKKVHISTVHRWISRGVRGRRLETILVGGERYTSWEALNRFFAERHCDPYPDIDPNRQKAIAQACAELDAEGV